MVLGWLTVEQALEKILGYVTVLETKETPIMECLGQVLAENVLSDFNIHPGQYRYGRIRCA